jgi:hypothetical protein
MAGTSVKQITAQLVIIIALDHRDNNKSFL